MSVVAFLAACVTEPTGTNGPPPPGTTPTDTPTDTLTVPIDTAPTFTGDTGPTTPTEPIDCTYLPPVPVAFSTVGEYSDAEDFDFDSDGYVGVVYLGNLVGKNYAGDQTKFIAAGVGSWTSGTRVLSTGDWVVADSGTGSLVRVDVLTGGQTPLTSAFSWPNGIEVGEGDQLYVSDFSLGRVFRINAYDPADFELIGEGLDQANGIVLSPDEDTLFVIESWTAAIVAFDRDPYGAGWTGPRLVYYQPGGDFQGLTADACGNLYVTDARVSSDSPILRVSPDGAVVEVLAILPTGYPPNAHFGSGIDGWERDVLYVSDRDQGRLFGLEAGIQGKTLVWE